MPYRMLCDDMQREDVKSSPDLASGLFCYVPLHKNWYGIRKESMPVVSVLPRLFSYLLLKPAPHFVNRGDSSQIARRCYDGIRISQMELSLITQQMVFVHQFSLLKCSSCCER